MFRTFEGVSGGLNCLQKRLRSTLKAMGVNGSSLFLVAGWSSQYSLQAALQALVASGQPMTRKNLRSMLPGLRVDANGFMPHYTLDTPTPSYFIGRPDGAADSGVVLEYSGVLVDTSIESVCY